jgi:hypothetical protein
LAAARGLAGGSATPQRAYALRHKNKLALFVTLVVSAQHTSARDALDDDSRLRLLPARPSAGGVDAVTTTSFLTLDGCSSVRGASRLRTGELRSQALIGRASCGGGRSALGRELDLEKRCPTDTNMTSTSYARAWWMRTWSARWMLQLGPPASENISSCGCHCQSAISPSQPRSSPGMCS